MAESEDPRQSLEYGRQAAPESESGRLLLLERQRDIPTTGDSRRWSDRRRMQHTWVSPNTLGEESTVTVTFKKQGEDTLMTLVHSGIPDTEAGRGHEKGWNYFLDIFPGSLEMARERRSSL